MYSSRNEYDRGVNTFSPEGRLFQVEYALGAVKLGSTSVGIVTHEGVILVTERRMQSRLLEPTHDAEKLRQIDEHILCASSGIIADALILIDHARVEAQHHRFTYDEKMSAEACVAAISELALEFSGIDQNRKKTISRPFGVALLVGAVDDDGPSLWCADPSGTTTKYQAAAIGAAQEEAESLLQESYKPDMSLLEAKKLALVVIRQVMEDKLTATNVEVGEISATTKVFRILSKDDIQSIIDVLPAQTTIA